MLSSTIRPAVEADLPAINDIYNHHVLKGTGTFDLAPLPLEERHRWFAAHGEQYPVLAAEIGGQVAGWASLSAYRSRPAYRFTAEDSIYVRDDLRGQGIGRLLLTRLLAEASRLGYHGVMAVIGDSANAASVGLHQSLGFRVVGIEREVGYKFGRWLDVVLMQWLAAENA